MQVSADIQYFAASNRVYFLSNNVGIHFLFTYYFPIRSFRLVPMFSGNTPVICFFFPSVWTISHMEYAHVWSENALGVYVRYMCQSQVKGLIFTQFWLFSSNIQVDKKIICWGFFSVQRTFVIYFQINVHSKCALIIKTSQLNHGLVENDS